MRPLTHRGLLAGRQSCRAGPSVLALIAEIDTRGDNLGMQRTTALATGTAATILGLLGAGLVLHRVALVDGVADVDGPWSPIPAIVAAVVPTAVGAAAAWRRPWNPVGWSLLGLGSAVALDLFTFAYAELGLLARPGGLWGATAALAYQRASWVPSYAALTVLALVFPDGRLPSRRWRPAAAGVALVILAAGVTVLLAPRRAHPPFDQFTNPAGVDLLAGPLAPLVPLALLAGLVVGAAAIAVRFRRARGVERLQLKWLALAGACVPGVLICCWVSFLGFGSLGLAFQLAWTCVHVGVAAAVGIAIFRHGLYDIDRLFTRTLVYATLTLVLGSGYAALALLLGVALGQGSPWATAGATLAVTVAFRPLRTGVRRAVDWGFDRAKYDALRTIERFVGDVQRGRASPDDVDQALRGALRDPSLALLFWLPESGHLVNRAGYPVAEPGTEDRRAQTPLHGPEGHRGVLLHDPAMLEHRELVRCVLEASGLTIEIMRLRVEARVQLAEVQAARARILAAGDAERRRIERDLHDGAQQRLVALGLSLRLLQRSLGEDAPSLRAALDDAVAEIGRAIVDLRDFARGARPAGLDQGLGVALRELAQRSLLPVKLELELHGE